MDVYDNDFCLLYKVLDEEELYLIRYILFVYDNCLYDILVCYIYYLYHVFCLVLFLYVI